MVYKLRERLLKEIQSHQSEYKEEQAFKPRFEDLLINYDDCFERALLTGHITASAWIFNHKRDSILLLHHAKLNKWLQPGGHADGDENVRAVAVKEAEEETGISGFIFATTEIFDLDIHTIPERNGVPEHEHFDIRFLLVAPERAVPQLNHESTDVKWIHMNNLVERISHEPSLLRMYAKSKRFI
ncbi:NUDIX hydrolase [Roseivirga echinicomitans]